MSDNEDDHDIEAGNGEDEPLSGENRLEDVPESSMMEKVSGAVAGVAVVSSVTAMALCGGAPLVIAAGCSSMALAPYAWYQQTKLTDIKALKDTHEALHREVETLQAENNRLRKNVDELGGTVGRLGDIEDALDTITQTQGQSVEAFKQQVEENRQILEQMQKNLKANVLQNLFSVVMNCDQDGDMTIDDDELEDVIEKMDNIKGVKVNKDLFRQAIIQQGRSLDAVMGIVRHLIAEGGDGRPEEEQIFVLTEM